MIIQCKSCSGKFTVKDTDIPEEGRIVQCGNCSVTWHQMPVIDPDRTIKIESINRTITQSNEELSVDRIMASDGKTYKFVGTQWAELLPSGKTGLFAKKKIGKELDKLTGRKVKKIVQKKQKKIKDEHPIYGGIDNEKQQTDSYEKKKGLGFFGYTFLLIIIAFSFVGIAKTFENDLINYYPEAEYIFVLINEQLEYVSETVNNLITIIKDLINSY